MNSKTIVTAMIAMIVAVGMTGAAMGASTMDYDTNFAGVGTGSVNIVTFTPIGSDLQTVTWTNCQAVGDQQGTYGNNGWMYIDRATKIDTTQNTQGDHTAVAGSIMTQSSLSTDGGSWTPGRVYTLMTLSDSYIGNPPEDYMSLVQNARLYDGDMQNGGTADYEKIISDTVIAARLFDNAGAAEFSAVVATTTDATTNASSGISATLQEGEIFMDVDSVLIDNAANVESSKTNFNIDVPNMPGYTEQNTGTFVGQTAINGVVTTSMMETFVNVDTADIIGYFYAVTP